MSHFLACADGDASRDALIELATTAVAGTARGAAAASDDASYIGYTGGGARSGNAHDMRSTAGSTANFTSTGTTSLANASGRANSAVSTSTSSTISAPIMFCSDCGRRGHGSNYIKLLLERPNWRAYPIEPW